MTRILEIFGTNPTIRVLELLITGRGLSYSVTDIAEGSETSRTKVYEVLKHLKNLDLVTVERQVGNTKLYWINQESRYYKIIFRFYKELLNFLGYQRGGKK